MIITQTVEIPTNRRLLFEIPRDIPTGRVKVELKIIPFVKKEENQMVKTPAFPLSKNELNEILLNAKTPITDSLTGILADCGNITEEQIREERLAKYL